MIATKPDWADHAGNVKEKPAADMKWYERTFFVQYGGEEDDKFDWLLLAKNWWLRRGFEKLSTDVSNKNFIRACVCVRVCEAYGRLANA